MLFTVNNAPLHAMCWFSFQSVVQIVFFFLFVLKYNSENVFVLKYISKTFFRKYLSENVGLGDPRAHLLHGHHCASQPCHQQVTLNDT